MRASTIERGNLLFWMACAWVLLFEALPPLAAAREGAARTALEGRVTFRGTVPRRKVADQAGVQRPLFVVDDKGGLKEAVVYLTLGAAAGGRAQRSEPEGQREKPPPLVIDQIEYTFVPHVVAVRAGHEVRFTSTDLANHNVRGHGLERKNQFNVFTGGGGQYTHRFVPEKKNRPVRIGCDLHPWMGAWIYVFDHANFAVTDGEGKFQFADVPRGRHVLHVRQPDARLERDMDVEMGEEEPAPVEVEFTEDDLRPD
jgi:plastocyanin